MQRSSPMEFWFEFASSYSYLSVMRIEALAAEAGIEVSWQPFMLGPVFMSLGWNDSPFNIYPPKGRYMWRDLERLCARYGLRLIRPTTFPRNGLLAARVAMLAREQDWIAAFARAVMVANFGDDRDIGDEAVIRDILESLGQPADQLLVAAASDENKAALHAQTARAAELGVFGAPSFRVDGELFWGNDRLEEALGWARGERPSLPA